MSNSKVFRGNRGTDAAGGENPGEVCMECGYTLMGHGFDNMRQVFVCPQDVKPVGVGGRLDAVFGVSEELVRKFGSPLAKAVINEPRTEPLSRRYEAIIRRKQEEARAQEQQRQREAAAKQAEAQRIEDERLATERRTAQAKAIRRMVDRGDIAPLTAAGALFSQPVKPVMQEAFLQMAVVQITTLYESWGIAECCSAEDVMSPARILAKAYEADREMDGASAAAYRASVDVQVRDLMKRKLALKYPARGDVRSREPEFWEDERLPPTDAPASEPAKKPSIGTSRRYYDKD